MRWSAAPVRNRAAVGADAADCAGGEGAEPGPRGLQRGGSGRFRICDARPQTDFSPEAEADGGPEALTGPGRDVRRWAGAEFVVAICGEIMTMPGLPRVPAANSIDLTEDGRITGLF